MEEVNDVEDPVFKYVPHLRIHLFFVFSHGVRLRNRIVSVRPTRPASEDSLHRQNESPPETEALESLDPIFRARRDEPAA